jgi:hypothetical protein
MSAYLAIEVTDRISVVFLALAVVAVARASASVLQTWIVQAYQTRRLGMSLEGTEPQERPSIIGASGQLERSSTLGTGEDRTDSGSLVDEHHRPLARILMSRHVHKHHGD